ncbi:MAG: glycosyltransferase family 4 protein, partial [Desulfobacteraceae bacterium]|nr:glycosyltransferase family 4 protein [Desulfobacteraceae bacterium]
GLSESIKKIFRFFCITADNLITAHISKINVQHASLVLTNSYYTREYIYKVYGVPAKVIYPGVDLSRFKNLNLKRKPYVMSVGGIEENKGFADIVHALARIPADKRPPLTIVAGRKQPRIYNELVHLPKKNILIFRLSKISATMNW